MASGEQVVQILDVMPPASSFALPGVWAGGSTPAERLHIFRFPDAAAAYLDFKCVLQGYDGGGLTFSIKWGTLTVTTNNCVWQLAIRRLADDAEDIDTSQTYDFNTVTAAAPSASGEPAYDTIAFTSGADMDSLADGEIFILRLFRDPGHASDNLGDEAQLWSLTGRET